MLRIACVAFLILAPLLSLEGEDALAHLGAADRLYAEERYVEAAQQYETALGADPGLEAARKRLAVCLFQIRDYNRARPLFERLLRKPENGRMTRYYLGRIELQQGRPEAAITHFEAIQGVPTFQDEYYFWASADFKLGRYDLASALLRKQIALNPRDSRAHLLLARVHRKLGENTAAEREFEETRRLTKYYLQGSVALKRCRVALSKEADPADACRPLTETDDVDKLSAAGVVFGEAQRHAEARQVLARAAALDPDSPEIRYNLALSCYYLHDFQCAEKNAAAALQIRSEFPEGNVLYGTLLYMAGSDRDALPVLRRAHRLLPDDTTVRRLLADVLLKTAERAASVGRTAEARAQLREVEALAPETGEVTRRLTGLRLRLSGEAAAKRP